MSMELPLVPASGTLALVPEAGTLELTSAIRSQCPACKGVGCDFCSGKGSV
ncbi:hypothetical protein GCM10027290_51580 [Micromonospora sonneratiae]